MCCAVKRGRLAGGGRLAGDEPPADADCADESRLTGDLPWTNFTQMI